MGSDSGILGQQRGSKIWLTTVGFRQQKELRRRGWVFEGFIPDVQILALKSPVESGMFIG
jgi:hypothetical protein